MISRSRCWSEQESNWWAVISTSAVPMTNSPKYHVARRNPNVRTSRSRSLENIASAAYGEDHGCVVALVHLLPQPEDGDVHDVAARIEVVAPHLRQNHGLRHHLSRVAHQQL